MRKWIIIVFIFSSFFSCEDKFVGFKKIENDSYMKLLAFEESARKFEKEYHTKADIKILADKEVIYRRYTEDIIFIEDNTFDDLLYHLNEGDSASFMVPTNQLRDKFSMALEETKTEYVSVIIKVDKYLSGRECKEYLQKTDKKTTEELLLKKYLKENDINSNKLFNGVYIDRIEEGSGKGIKDGDVITIKYKSYFVNLLEFDNSYKGTEFSFTYGTPGQVIEGLNIAINDMKQGEKSKIIIPSQFGFGELGSSTQIVQPYTTVIYELEIINIK